MKPLPLLVAASAVVALTACSQTSQSSSPRASITPTVGSTVLVNCPQRYASWRNGPAKKILEAVNAVGSAVAANDVQAQEAAVKRAAPAVDAAATYPIPDCADPKGYWNALLLHVNAAAHSAKTATGTASMTIALKAVPGLVIQLNNELKRTTEVK